MKNVSSVLPDHAHSDRFIPYFSDHRASRSTGSDQFAQIYEHSPDMQISIDPKSAKILRCNETLATRLGYSKSEIVGRNIFSFYAPEYLTEAKRLFAVFQETGRIREAELAVLTKNQEKIPVTLNVEAVRDERGNLLFSNSVWRDISQVKELQRDLRLAKEKLEEKVKIRTKELKQRNQELKQFAYVASHDLREPIRSLNGFVNLLERKLEHQLDEEALSYLTYIKQAGDRMGQMIAGLLDHTALGNENCLKSIDLNQVLVAVQDDLSLQSEQSGSSISVSDLPVLIGYETELRLLFQNLISNAIKFRAKDRPSIIKVSARRTPENWIFSVTDNGIGIPKIYQDRIFGIFQRLHTKDSVEGSGIGLAHCKKIVELHHGEMWIESVEGEGSTFYFTIPTDLDSLAESE